MNAKELLATLEGVVSALKADQSMWAIHRGKAIKVADAPASVVWAYIKGQIDDEIKRSKGA